MSRRTFERKKIANAMKNISSPANEGGIFVSRKPRIGVKSQTLKRSHLLEKIDPCDRCFWKRDSDSVIDFCGINHQTSPCSKREQTKIQAKQTQEEKKKNGTNKKSVVSIQNHSHGTNTTPVERAISKNPKAMKNFELAPYIERNLLAWTKQVFAHVGPSQKERIYQIALKEMLMKKGFEVASEAALTFQREGSENIGRRADLIIKMPGISERVLIELKAKKKLERKDFEQVLFYQQHFGITECYLINFCAGSGLQVLKKKTNA